jgi:dTDP-4-amino-4,6-dideoxygalactose transaminase
MSRIRANKRNLDDLALFGGGPAFGEKVHVGRPNVPDRKRFMERVEDIFDRRWFSNNGVCVQELERKLEAYLGVKHCIAVCNATVGLELAIRAFDLKGEVIVPSFTFVATAHALQWQEITPVFCDIDPVTHHLDPRVVKKMITPYVTGIVGVHTWGRPCAIDELTALAQHFKIKLIYDAAHAFGCSHKGKMIGNFGDAEVFSFHATKIFNTFEGGAIATNNDDVASKIRLMKNFGFSGYDRVIHLGVNGKMNEVSAAMGLTCLESLDYFIEANRRNYENYRKHLGHLRGLKLMEYGTENKFNYHHIVIEVDAARAGLSRDQLIRILQAENVMARRYFFPGCHRMEPYRSHWPQAGVFLKQTEALCDRILILPTGSAIATKEVNRICAIIEVALANAAQARKRWPQTEEATAPGQTAVRLHAK